jgi:transcriptional regulator with XRE-family HTH domain
MAIRAIFSTNLKRLRAERNLSQESLANAAGIERAYLGLMERKVSAPTIDMLERLAKVLKVTPDELIKPVPKSRR